MMLQNRLNLELLRLCVSNTKIVHPGGTAIGGRRDGQTHG